MEKIRLGTKVKAHDNVHPSEIQNLECTIVANRDREYLLIPDAQTSRIFYHLLPEDFDVIASTREPRPGRTKAPVGNRPANLDF
jgi:hypothetical protein